MKCHNCGVTESNTHATITADGVWGLILLAARDNFGYCVPLCNAFLNYNFLTFLWNLMVAVLSQQISSNVFMHGSSMSCLLSACMTTEV